jgi:hypothetical protein
MPPKRARQLSESQFQQVFSKVRADIDSLQLNEKVFSGVIENLTQHQEVGQWFPAFFAAFWTAMRTDLIVRLGRIYDPGGTGHDSCTLERCLYALRDSPQFFTDAAITARLSEGYRKANPNYLSAHRLGLQRIQKDINSIVGSHKRLMVLRHKVYAHNDLETVLSGKREEFLSSHEEVRALIQLAHDVWNHYSGIWSATTSSSKTIGDDDYKRLF